MAKANTPRRVKTYKEGVSFGHRLYQLMMGAAKKPGATREIVRKYVKSKGFDGFTNDIYATVRRDLREISEAKIRSRGTGLDSLPPSFRGAMAWNQLEDKYGGTAWITDVNGNRREIDVSFNLARDSKLRYTKGDLISPFVLDKKTGKLVAGRLREQLRDMLRNEGNEYLFDSKGKAVEPFRDTRMSDKAAEEAEFTGVYIQKSRLS